MKKKYLIIGENSFIGQHLLTINKIRRNYFSLSINPKNKKNIIVNKNTILFSKIDKLFEYYGIPHTVFFLSWKGMDDIYSKKKNFYNYKIYKKLTEYFYNKKVKNIIFFGSIKEYGNKHVELSEDLTKLNPISYYGKYKLRVGMSGLKLANTMKKNFLHLRISHVFGFNKNKFKLLNKIFFQKHYKEDRDLNFFRNMIYIDDLKKIILKCIDIPFNGVVNIGSNYNCIYSQFINNYCQIANIKNIISHPKKKILSDENYKYFNFSIKKMIKKFKFKKFTDYNIALKKIFLKQQKLFFIK